MLDKFDTKADEQNSGTVLLKAHLPEHMGSLPVRQKGIRPL